jgi:hypothetical protein
VLRYSAPAAVQWAARVVIPAGLAVLAAMGSPATPHAAGQAWDPPDLPEIEWTILLPAAEPEDAAPAPGARARPQVEPERTELAVAGLAGTRSPATGTATLWGRLAVQGGHERFARDLLDLLGQQGAALSSGGDDIARRDQRRAGRLTHEFYEQLHAGLPIIGSRLTFTYGPDGALLHLTARTPGELSPPGPPLLSLAEAQTRAFASLALPGAIAWTSGELAVLPALFSGLPDDRVVWRLRAVTGPAPLGWRILVDARSGEVLERRPMVHWAARGASADAAVGFTGSSAAWLHTPTPWGAYQQVPLSHQLVTLLVGGSLLEQNYTGATGGFAFQTDPEPDRTVRALLEGRHAQVHIGDRNGDVPDLEMAPPAEGLAVVWDSLTASPAALSAYVHAERAHAWLVRIDPSFTWLDRPLPIVVDDPTMNCNALAYDDPQDPWLRFLAGNQECTNSARLADVVYHEYGHLVTTFAYDPDDAPGALHEAFSDYFAATITDTSAIGLHFFGPDEPALRDLDHDFTWPVPERCIAIPHCLGLLLGGALWHMRAGLIESLGDTTRAVGLADSLFHFMRAGKPQDFDECLVQLVLQDDDDGDLSNGTPHLETIAAAFARHNIGDFTVHVLHRTPPDREDTTATMPIDVAVRSIYPPAPGGVRIHYALGDDEGTAVMLAVEGSDRVYRWELLPPQPAGSVLRYFITTEDTHGQQTTIPPGAPSERYEVTIGPDLLAPTITHDRPNPPAAGQTGLWLTAMIHDNSDRIESVSVRGTVSTSTGSRAVTAELTARSSADSLFTGFLATGELAAGDTLRYHIEAVDQARTPNSARFPVNQEILQLVLPGRFWDLESAPLDLALTGDWAWGTPAGDSVHAVSGTSLLATQLAGYYSADTRSYASLPELDMSGWTNGLLEFSSWYRSEDGWDGGWIEASTDGGQLWRQLSPAGGYPGAIPYDRDGNGVDESEIAAFTGDSGGWQRVLVPLDAQVGNNVRLRLAFDSDALVENLGWYVDDFKVLAAQALVAPTDLSASTGEDGRVALRWSAPVGIIETAASFAGYNVYRGTDPGVYDPAPLNAAPHRAHWWYDSQVENGMSYYYAVTSVFNVGESAPSREAVGYPYRATLGGDPLEEGVVAHITGSTAGVDTLWIANAGTGQLELEIFPAGADQPWEEVRPKFVLTPTSAFQTIARDPAGDADGPDLRRLACRSTGDHLQFRIEFGGPLPDPLSEFTLAVFLDTDLKRTTGIPGPNVGAEYVIVLGQDTFRRFGQLDVIIDSRGQVLGRPSHLILQAGLDSIEVAVPVATIGGPAEVGVGIALGAEGLLPDPTLLRPAAALLAAPTASGATVHDSLPGPLVADWLSCETISATLLPGTPWGLPLGFDFSGRIEDEYRARIWIVSNDPATPRCAAPVVVDLSDLPVEGLDSWSAASVPEGLRLSWAPADHEAFVGFLLARWQGELDQEDQAVTVGGGLIAAPDGTHYEFLDRSVASGQRYFYRLSGVRSAGDTLAFAPPAHPRYGPVDAGQLVLEAARPNPFRGSTLLRVRAPAGRAWDLVIFDVGGRLVRRLVGRGDLGPGMHLITWDGRTQAGSPAAGGVYYARARASGQGAVRSLLLIR